MPKMKTKSSAKKRFKLTGTGKIKRKHAFKSHLDQEVEEKENFALPNQDWYTKAMPAISKNNFV